MHPLPTQVARRRSAEPCGGSCASACATAHSSSTRTFPGSCAQACTKAVALPPTPIVCKQLKEHLQMHALVHMRPLSIQVVGGRSRNHVEAHARVHAHPPIQVVAGSFRESGQKHAQMRLHLTKTCACVCNRLCETAFSDNYTPSPICESRVRRTRI